MQVRDNDTLLLYGLFQSICGWALDKGYRDISTMKHLLKLAMVDAARQHHEEEPISSAQMSVVADLGISLRNVQYSMKALDELNSLSTGFVKIRQIHRELMTILTKGPQTFQDLLAEVSYLIHAPYDLQRRALLTILKDLEQKGHIRRETEKSKTLYYAAEAHASLFDPADMSARISGLLSHLDAFRNTVGQPLLKVYRLHPHQAEGLQRAIHELLVGTGNAYEHECTQVTAVTKPYYYYMGSCPVDEQQIPGSIPEAILTVIQNRFQNGETPSTARTHWYHLSPEFAGTLFQEISRFIHREASAAKTPAEDPAGVPFAFYFGMADRKNRMSNEGTPS
ncbi:MAG: hypothetical protein C4524_08805 [Candidatus Zixiibacteriota bacterium]|nr:MAG: hypothetical protein C4524_08805 [candidate division Zixibacteria bacterium]